MLFLSIIIPSYNREHSVTNSINSVLQQSEKDVEIIVVDDGSTDNTKETLSDLIESKTIKYIFQQNKGVCAARNEGAKNAIGKYLLFLDSDDFLVSDAIEQFKITSKCEDVQLLFGDIERRVSQQMKGEVVKATDPYGKGIGKGLYLAGAFCIKRDFFNQLGGYDEAIKYGENAELKFRIEKNNPTMAFVNKVVMIYNVAEEGGNNNLINKVHSNEYIIKKHLDYFTQYPRVLQFYLQNNAVAYVKLHQFKDARQSIKRAWLAYPKSIKTFIRMIIMFFPFFSKRIWR